MPKLEGRWAHREASAGVWLRSMKLEISTAL